MNIRDEILNGIRAVSEARERRLIVLIHPDQLHLVGSAIEDEGYAHLVDLKASPVMESGKAIVIDPKHLLERGLLP